MATTIRLTEEGEKLLKEQLAARPEASPEEIVERALQSLARQNGNNTGTERHKMTPAQAYAEVLEARKNLSLGGIKIKDLINEGRKY
jgi:hypothetical protein